MKHQALCVEWVTLFPMESNEPFSSSVKISWNFLNWKSISTKCDHRIFFQNRRNSCFAWNLLCTLSLSVEDDLFVYEIIGSGCAFEEFLSHDYQPSLAWPRIVFRSKISISNMRSYIDAYFQPFLSKIFITFARNTHRADSECGVVVDIIKILNVPIFHAFHFVKHSRYY